jgi:hypothetical protein
MNPIIWLAMGFGGVLALGGLWVWTKLSLTYQIGRSSFRILLFGFTLRRIPLKDIQRVDKPHRDLRWAETENWRNTFDDSRRILVIHRNRGWFRKLVITPTHRYEFRQELRDAVMEATGDEANLSEISSQDVEANSSSTDGSAMSSAAIPTEIPNGKTVETRAMKPD